MAADILSAVDLMLAYPVGSVVTCTYQGVGGTAHIMAHVMYEADSGLPHSFRLLVEFTSQYGSTYRRIGHMRSSGLSVWFVETGRYGTHTATHIRNDDGGVYLILAGSAE